MSQPASRCQRTTASLSVRFQVDMASSGSAGSSMSRRPSAMRTSLAWTIPAMPSLIVRRYWSSASTKARGSNRPPSRGGYRPGMTQLGMGLHHVVLLHERLFGQLPVHREAAGVPPLGPQRLHLPGVEDGGERLDALPQRRRVVVEVDPGAPAPHLAPHRREVEVLGLQVVLGERLRLRDEGVRAVGAVAPPVERADEPALARPPALDDLDAAVAAGVLEGPHAQVVGAHHDDRLVEDLVLDEVARLGDLLEPARHLPDPGPQQLDLHLVEVRVEVALLAGPGPGTPSRRAPGVPTTSGPRSPCGPFPSRTCVVERILTGRYKYRRRSPRARGRAADRHARPTGDRRGGS